MVSEGSEPELKQLNAYLLKASIESDAEVVKDRADIARHPLRVESGLIGALYVREPEGRPVPWLPVIESLVDADLGDLRNRHVSAALIVRRGDRWFALTFGFGRFLLRPEAFEADFGLKVAASLMDPDSVMSFDARSFEERVLQTRRQSSDASSAEAIGLDSEREMLRALTGTPRDRELGSRVSGSVGTGLTTQVTASGLGMRLDSLYEAYGSGRHRERFSHIDRWHPVEDRALREDLDRELLERVRANDPSVRLTFPEIINWENASGFTYTGIRDQIFPIPDLRDYVNSRSREPTLADLERHELRLIAADSNEVIGSWPIYNSLLWEVSRGATVYALLDGAWVAVDADYVRRIDDRLRLMSRPSFLIPAFDPLEIEMDYNRRLASLDARRAFLDADLAHFEHERGGVEICDVFTPEGEFIHVKRGTAAKSLSHLFAQGATSADLFRNLPAFRDRCREALSTHPHLAALIPEDRIPPDRFEVVYLIVTPRPGDVPVGLPFFSRSHLFRIVEEISRLDFRLSIGGAPIQAGARPAAAGLTIREQRAAINRLPAP